MTITIEALLADAIERLRASGSESARLDAELLLGMAIGAERTSLRAHPEAPVGADAAATFETALARREAGEPVAYIRGFKEFHGLAFSVDARALIPRPETETLVDLADGEVMARLTGAPRPDGAPPLALVDVGTGSGAIAVALTVALRRRGADGDVEILATDRSADALALSKENAVGHGVADRMRFAEADLLPDGAGPFDVVLANLPYVQTDAVADAAGRLVVRATGRARRRSGRPRRHPNGSSIGSRTRSAPAGSRSSRSAADQGESIVTAVAERLPGWTCTVAADLAGLPRVARVARAAQARGA